MKFDISNSEEMTIEERLVEIRRIKKSIYNKEYNQRPEVKEYKRIFDRKRSKDPIRINYCKQHSKRYLKRPEAKARRKIWDQLTNVKERTNLRNKLRRRTEPEYKIRKNIATRFRRVLDRHINGKNIRGSRKHGVDYPAIIKHLKPFPKNTNLYHIDHVRPLCSFNFFNKDGSENLNEIQLAFAPENHQWLLIKDNLKKGSKWDGNIKDYEEVVG